MARTKQQAPEITPVIPSNSLVASAVRYPGTVPRIHNHLNQSWQKECYRHYAICGEARAAARFFGRALSRSVLRVTREVQDGVREVVTDGVTYDLLEDLFNGKDGQAQMLESIGIHLTIAGECYLIGRTVTAEDDDGNIYEQGEVWEVVSVLEVKVLGAQWAISYGDGYADIPLKDDDIVIRIWQPNPAKRIEADSPFRSLLPILSEIEWLTRHVFAQLSSRLAGAGILFLPQGMTFPAPPETGGKASETANEADLFMRVLGDAMMTPLEDPSSPSSLIPIIVTAPADAIDKAQLMTFWTELDANSKEMRGEAIHRFAVGMDLPSEQIEGMASNSGTGGGTSNGVSHWGAWQIEESTIKMYVEPMAELVVNALVVSYIRTNAPNETDEVIADTSALRLRPDRSKEAIELWQAGAISTARMLQENGFDPHDQPDEDEIKRYFLRKIASGSATPEQVEAALEEIGIVLNSGRYQLEQGPIRETRPDPSLEDHPTRPRTPGDDEPVIPQQDAALLAACDGLVYRALEKAGNRVLNARTRGKDRPVGVDPLSVHCDHQINGQGPKLLADAFTFAPQVLAGIADPDRIIPTLRAYCLHLFDDQMPHSKERLAAFMEASA
jgi:hypothetical protein